MVGHNEPCGAGERIDAGAREYLYAAPGLRVVISALCEYFDSVLTPQEHSTFVYNTTLAGARPYIYTNTRVHVEPSAASAARQPC
jgi:hypothetical protein